MALHHSRYIVRNILIMPAKEQGRVGDVTTTPRQKTRQGSCLLVLRTTRVLLPRHHKE